MRLLWQRCTLRFRAPPPKRIPSRESRGPAMRGCPRLSAPPAARRVTDLSQHGVGGVWSACAARAPHARRHAHALLPSTNGGGCHAPGGCNVQYRAVAANVTGNLRRRCRILGLRSRGRGFYFQAPEVFRFRVPSGP